MPNNIPVGIPVGFKSSLFEMSYPPKASYDLLIKVIEDMKLFNLPNLQSLMETAFYERSLLYPQKNENKKSFEL